MKEIRDGKTVLITPVTDEDLADLRIGDIVYLDGELATLRDSAHRRALSGVSMPVDLQGKALYHAGPIVRPGPDGSWEMVSCGPTTSMRMERYEKDFLPLTGVKVIVGKGGMKEDTAEACRTYKAVHCVFPAGCAVVAAEKVEAVTGNFWDDLGMAESLWCCRVKEMGPLIVSIDTQGRNLFEENRAEFLKKRDEAAEKIRALFRFMG